MDDIDRSLSIKLYDVMEKVGVSEKIRTLYRDNAIIWEIITTISYQIRDKPITTFNFGSAYEGTTTDGLDSDVDNVHCDERYPVIDDRQAAPRGYSYLMVRDDYTYPGYVKLQLIIDGKPVKIFNNQKENGLETDTKGRKCKTHVTMCLNKHDHERHGPADAAQSVIGLKSHDNDSAFRCRTIPKYAQMWLHRRRQCNWPSYDNLQKMFDFGCFVVGVGLSSSREQHIEWRLSFSLQERLLMSSLNLTQHKCYVLLKIIKNDVIKADIGECITSYHCKTCLFYALEVTQAALWIPENLVCCVRLCLIILLTWVVNGVCPNYFIPSENMFEKPQFRAKRYRLLELLQAIIAGGNSIVLRMQCDNIGNLILQPGIVQNNVTDTIIYEKYLNMYKLINRFSYDLYISANNCPVTFQNVMALTQFVEMLTNIRVIGEHSEQQTKDVTSYMIPLLHQHIAQRLASLVCEGQGQEYARELLYLSIHHFKHGNCADLMISRLLLVSFLLRLEKYDLCEIILENIEHDLKSYIVTYCSCYSIGRLNVIHADLLQHLSTNNVSFKTAFSTVYVDCVRFARCDTEIAPSPLPYEMYRSSGTPPGSRDDEMDKWFDLAVVDGKIYMYFLQYLVYSRLNRQANKKVAIANLLWVVKNDPNQHHTETTYNIIGWIHVQEGQIPEALRCFVASWKIKPVHNAAKWHLGVALYKYCTR